MVRNKWRNFVTFGQILRFLSFHNITLTFTLFPFIWTYFHVSFHFITLHWPWLCFYHLNDLVRTKIVQFDRLTIHVYERTFINHCGPSSSYPIIQVYERPFINYHRTSNRGDTSLLLTRIHLFIPYPFLQAPQK